MAVVNLEMVEEKWLDPEWRQAEIAGSSEGWEQDRSQGKLQESRPGRRDMWWPSHQRLGREDTGISGGPIVQMRKDNICMPRAHFLSPNGNGRSTGCMTLCYLTVVVWIIGCT